MDEHVTIRVASPTPPDVIVQGERNYCADCGYPIAWTESFGWVHSDPKKSGFAFAPPAHHDGSQEGRTDG